MQENFFPDADLNFKKLTNEEKIAGKRKKGTVACDGIYKNKLIIN